MPLRTTNTFAEGLQKILVEIANLEVLPDADLETTGQLREFVLQILRQPTEQMAAQGQTAVPPMGGGMGGGMPGGMGGGMGAMPGGGGDPMAALLGMGGGGMPPGGASPSPQPSMPGMRAEPPMPSPDELSRLLSGVTGA